jgi:tRNA A-37 threonylcarbamoyl transferase component Bud32
MRSFIQVKPDVERLFPQGGSLAFWLDSNEGEVVSKDRRYEVRRISVDTESGRQVFYLKRSGQELLLRRLRMLLHGQWPRTGTLRELQILQKLQSAGFATMEPVAWGEERRFGFPLRGFLMAREVPGQEAMEVYQTASGADKCRLMESVGELVGRLHSKGFFHPVRLKDLICTEQGLVLIDRETSTPWQSIFLAVKCRELIIRAFRRSARCGQHFGPGSICAFLRGYSRGVSDRWKISPLRLAQFIFSEARRDASSQ